MTSDGERAPKIPSTGERESVIRQALERFLKSDPDLERILSELAEDKPLEAGDPDKSSED